MKLNYKRMIERYLRSKHLRIREEKLAVKFYFDVENKVLRKSDYARLNLHETILFTALRYRMTEEEAGIIHMIGADIIATIDKQRFINNKA